MATRPTSARTRRSAEEFGQHLRTWRKLLGLTAEQTAERAGINRNTLSRLERGDSGVGFDVVLNVLRALGQLDALLKAVDPYESDLGRARADQTLPVRVRR